jgi:hypothetical protein
MANDPEIEKQFRYLGQELIDEILKVSVVKDVPKNAELIREGDMLKFFLLFYKGWLRFLCGRKTKNYCFIIFSQVKPASCPFQPA